MALGSRIHKVGSIYSRVRNMLNTGVMEGKERPLWFDVYEAFPPKREPVLIPDPTPDQNGLVHVEDTVRPLLYREDWARATATRLHNDFDAIYDLQRPANALNSSEVFIDTFIKLQKLYPDLPKEEVFEKTEEALKDK